MESISKKISVESASLILDEVAWDVFMNCPFEIFYDENADTYALFNTHEIPAVYGLSLSIKELNELLKSFNPFWVKIDKSKYTGIVEFTLRSMFDLARNDSSYCLVLDLIHYYKSKIAPEGELSADEFLNLVLNIASKQRKGK